MTDTSSAYHDKAYICIHVFEGHPVLLVSRADGDWCFLCGGLHADDASQYRVAGLGHVVDRDPSLVSVLDLPSDWEAERADPASDWVRHEVED